MKVKRMAKRMRKMSDWERSTSFNFALNAFKHLHPSNISPLPL
jgi:hypothetical protein